MHARIIPKGGSFLLELIYDRKTQALRSIKNIIAVDLGVNNIITAVSNKSSPFRIKGKVIKSINQWFNIEKARLMSIYKRQNPDVKYVEYGRAMKHLLNKSIPELRILYTKYRECLWIIV